MRSAEAADKPQEAPTAPQPVANGFTMPTREDPDAALLAALRDAPRTGMSAPELAARIGRSRSWTFARLRAHARAGRVVSLRHRRWAAGRTGRARETWATRAPSRGPDRGRMRPTT